MPHQHRSANGYWTNGIQKAGTAQNWTRLALVLWLLLQFHPAALAAADDITEPSQAPTLGRFFARRHYSPAPSPKFASTRDQLPAPIYGENTNWVALYWKSWKLAFRNFHEPAPASGFVSQFIDAAFDQNIFQWDTCFLTMFCNTAHPLVPGIGSLDNFYCRQYPDGEIARDSI